MTAARIAEHLNPDDGDAGVSLGHQQGCQSNLLAEVCPARGNNGDIKIISTASALVVIAVLRGYQPSPIQSIQLFALKLHKAI